VGGRQSRQWLARAMGLALLLQLLFAPAPVEALSWRIPGRGAPPSGPTGSHAGRRLQEVSPPEWVQKARAALEDRDPRVRILAPADGDLLPAGPWTLRLQVSDWPLVDAGPLGLGPHLVVQLDGEPPRSLVDTELEMPALTPGSHRLTVYAAKPWGEAHKSPLALQQIRLHRLAPNPATLPAPGSPQLIPVSPTGLAGPPPLLLDWLLVDAPLQGLRGDASGWRLRLTVNGESVLVDQQLPLWLQGWKQGSNALLLELLDGRGEPLNPPFNTLLQEVIVPAAGTGDLPRFRSVPATDLEMAVLLGEQPVSALLPFTAPEVPAPSSPPTAPSAAASVPTPSSDAREPASLSLAPVAPPLSRPGQEESDRAGGSAALPSPASVPSLLPSLLPATPPDPGSVTDPAETLAPAASPALSETLAGNASASVAAIPAPAAFASPEAPSVPERSPSPVTETVSESASGPDRGETPGLESTAGSAALPGAVASPSLTQSPGSLTADPARTAATAQTPEAATVPPASPVPSSTPSLTATAPDPQSPAPPLNFAAPALEPPQADLEPPAPALKPPAPDLEPPEPALDPPAPVLASPAPGPVSPPSPPESLTALPPPETPAAADPESLLALSEALAAPDPPIPVRAEGSGEGSQKRPAHPTPLERLRERLGR
jgi:hypothetical protein